VILQLKAAILQKLQPLSARVRIVSDDTEGEAGTASQVRSDYTLRVGYSGGTFTPPDTRETIGYQYCDRAFQIAIEIRDLRSEDKAVQLLEDVEDLLLGFCPCVPGVIGDFFLQSDRFVQNRDGIYFYTINLSIPTIKNKS
jgi:hypothetical protein